MSVVKALAPKKKNAAKNKRWSGDREPDPVALLEC